MSWRLFLFWILCCLVSFGAKKAYGQADLAQELVPSASSSNPGHPASGAIDHQRLSLTPGAFWQGLPGRTSWWWQVRFPDLRQVGAILQIVGDHDFVLRQAPRRYVWQSSQDGVTWTSWPETAQTNETRLYRLHRLRQMRAVRFVRVQIDSATGDAPTLREVEFFADPKIELNFPEWIVVVNTTHDSSLPGHGREFIPLARSCAAGMPAQQVWLAQFDRAYVAAEPRPLCAFLSGNFKDWCEVDRSLWRGTEAVLRHSPLPLWASCGGAQALALLWEYGADRPWDCPHCRDPRRPLTPLYTHIGHTATRPCGDYSGCVFERGPHQVKAISDDPVLRGLPATFPVIESHCGQIERPPHGWSLLVTAGPDTQTRVQCMRLGGRAVYAAQFHIEMAGTPETSRLLMQNFLGLARNTTKSLAPDEVRR